MSKLNPRRIPSDQNPSPANAAEQESEVVSFASQIASGTPSSESKTLPSEPRIRHEAPGQRRHIRTNAPAHVFVHGRKYRTVNWSLGGFLVKGLRDDVVPGQRVKVRFELDFQGFSIGFDQIGRVLRFDDSDEMIAIRYEEELSSRHRELLTHFIATWVRGDTTSIGNTLVQLDRPVTPLSTLPDDPDPKGTANRVKRRCRLGTLLYTAVGLLVTGFLALTIYHSFFALSVDTAVVTRDWIPVSASYSGIIEELSVSLGDTVNPSAPLFRVDNTKVNEELAEARLRVHEAKVQLNVARLRSTHSQERLRIYQDIAARQVALAADRVAALETQVESAEKELARMETLRDGILSDSHYDRATADLARLRGQRDIAIRELKIAETGRDSVVHGYFYNGRQLIAETSDSLNLEIAQQRVKSANKRLKLAEANAATLTAISRVNGRVVKINKLPGSTIQPGETVLFIEPMDASPRVDVYLTQEEVAKVSEFDRVRVYVSALRKRFEGHVQTVERSTRHVDSDLARFHWMDGRRALVTIALDPLGAKDTAALSSDLPALVNFSTQRAPGWARFLSDTVSSLFDTKQAYAETTTE